MTHTRLWKSDGSFLGRWTEKQSCCVALQALDSTSFHFQGFSCINSWLKSHKYFSSQHDECSWDSQNPKSGRRQRWITCFHMKVISPNEFQLWSHSLTIIGRIKGNKAFPGLGSGSAGSLWCDPRHYITLAGLAFFKVPGPMPVILKVPDLQEAPFLSLHSHKGILEQLLLRT